MRNTGDKFPAQLLKLLDLAILPLLQHLIYLRLHQLFLQQCPATAGL
jgi:hypothetical protein